jgi:FkbM family methyltransferase
MYYTYGVQMVNAAIGDQTGKITLSMPENENDDQLASITQNFPKKIEVDCITVEDLFKRHHDVIQDPGILSVDTEGFDLPILKQWMATENRPQIIITESWPHLAYANLEKMSLLNNKGYKKILHFGENEIFIRNGI